MNWHPTTVFRGRPNVWGLNSPFAAPGDCEQNHNIKDVPFSCLLVLVLLFTVYYLTSITDTYRSENTHISESRHNASGSPQHVGGIQKENDGQERNISDWLSDVNKRSPTDISFSVKNYSKKDLLIVRSLDALPFLLSHISENKDICFSFGNDVVLETHPYLEAVVVQYGTAGIVAMIEYVSKQDEYAIPDEQIELLAYGVLVHCGFDEGGRKYAISLTHMIERRQKRTGALNCLRKQIMLMERCYR